jgi:hypothetical protein
VRWHNKRFHSRPGYVAEFWNDFVSQYFSLFQSLAQFTARRVKRSVSPPNFDACAEYIKYLKKIYKKVFEIELESWSIDKGTWPKKRSFSLFEKWFYIEFHSEVFDALGTDIEKEDY